jgi:hypothetical protein
MLKKEWLFDYVDKDKVPIEILQSYMKSFDLIKGYVLDLIQKKHVSLLDITQRDLIKLTLTIIEKNKLKKLYQLAIDNPHSIRIVTNSQFSENNKMTYSNYEFYFFQITNIVFYEFITMFDPKSIIKVLISEKINNF